MIALCPLEDVPNPGSLRVDNGTLRVVVVRIDDDVWVLDDTCSHAEASLAEGELWVEEREIECPRHGSAFTLDEGVPQSLPATRPVATYDVAIVDGVVNIAIPA